MKMMKQLILTITIGLCSLTMSAQDNCLTTDSGTCAQAIESAQLRGRRVATPEEKEYARRLAQEQEDQAQIDSNLPLIDDNGQVRTGDDFYSPFYPYGLYGWGGWTPWRLHKGLNVNVGASVFANFGGGARHGAGFTQDISLMYVTNLSKKATLAIGGYFNNMTYGGDNYTAAGVNAVLGYRFDDHWSAYAFIQKAFTSDNYYMGYYSPYWGDRAYGYGSWGYHPYYGYAGMGIGYGSRYGLMNNRMMDRIGGGVRYEWGEHNFLQIQVEVDRMPEPRFGYNRRRYDYPVY